MQTAIRIVAGSLRGRKIACSVNPELRPTPQMVREALFSILGNAVPGRWFVDVFAGTGVVGLEALSRGASAATFVERDVRLANAIEQHLRRFELTRQARVYRTDAYRWAASWQPPSEPVNIFLSPPFADLQEHPDLLLQAVQRLQTIVAPDTVIVLQSEKGSPLDESPELLAWEHRAYGRNVLMIWQKEIGIRNQESEPGARGPMTSTDSTND
ncbi:MAG: 16S rRNA (guanine(966)-N(2))-methyltransferase RsmD [Gemmataceae bacterium]|nr:16S rRNA (guanine(966)-N(2))-methyltransferase RsmD [Gemmataceae bacterium]